MIGHLGEKVFLGNCPDNWIKESSPQQGGDFAFDLMMWLATLGQINGRFAVQLKASASVTISGSDEPYVSVELTRQVCNLFLQDGNPVLLVFIALESPESSENAAMYYLWIKEEIKKRLEGRTELDETLPEKMSFRVPLSNRLTKDLDIAEYLRGYWTLNRIANQLQGTEHGAKALQTVSALSPRGMLGLTKADPHTLNRWFSNESLAGDSLWPTPKSGTSVAKIKQLAEYITYGNAVEADRLISELNDALPDDAETLAEMRYQEGRRALLDHDTKNALSKFSEATSLQPTLAKYYAVELEAAVAANVGQAERVPPEILTKAESFGADDEVKFQLVRVAALQGELARAEELITGLSEPNKIKAQTLYLAIRDDWQGVLSTADRGISGDSDARTKRFLKVLKLRALLNIATGGENSISVGGRPGLKVSDAIALRDATMESLREAQASGWPANSEMILDCASAVCVTFGPDRELLNLLSDFAQKRPKLRDAQETLARVATFIEEPSIAISALTKIENPDAVDLARLVLLYSESGEHTKAVEVALGSLIDKPHETIVDVAVATAAVSAYRLSSTSDEARLRAFVAHGDPAAQSLLRFIVDSLKHPEERAANLDRLWEDAMRDGGDETLQDNLLQYLRPDRESDVDRILEICEVTAQRRNLTEMESAKFSASLLRRERFQELIEFTERAQEFYPENENVGLTRAIALERISQPSAAEQVLRRFDNSVRTDLINARTQLLLRVGDVEALISLTRRALAAATSHEDRFYYRRTLATLYSRGDRAQYLESVWQLGEIVSKDVESEEGAFLLHFLMATAGDDVEVEQARVQEFQERVKRFTERFPDSSILRVGHIQDDASPEDLLAQLQRMAGVSEERAKAQQKARAFGERSGSHIPVAFRPRTYAPYTTNVADLLRITIHAWHRGESSRVVVGDVAFPKTEPSRPPILDLVTVLLLVELGLFDKLFSVWTAVAIPKESLAHLSELMFGPHDAGNSDLIDQVLEAIRRNRSAIVQPGAPDEDRPAFPHSEFATIKAEVASKRYEYLTVDLAAAAILSIDASIVGHCRTLWDFLQAAEAKGALNATEAMLVRLRVASWNTVGTPLEPADMAAAALGAADGQADDDSPAARAVTKFFATQDLHGILKGISRVLVKLARGADTTHTDAAAWFTRLFYREAVFARSIGFNATTDDLTAQLAVLSVAEAHEDPNAHALMGFVWRVLEDARTAFGGSVDRDKFFKLLGKRAAVLFDGIVKKHGLEAISVEARITDLLFSLTTPGTQDRAVLEEAYFAETKALQTRKPAVA